MKKKEPAGTLPKKVVLFTNKSRHLPLFISFFFIVCSCNNDPDKKKEDFKVETGKTVDKGGGPAPMAITQYPKFRIETGQLTTIDKKIILTVAFDNMSDPSTMSLYFFHVTKAGTLGTTGQASATTDIASPFDTNEIMVSNNELIFAEYKWTDIDYIILEPFRSTDNLGFRVTAFKNDAGGGSTEITLPIPTRSTKPSPPAPPALIPKSK